MLEKDITKYDCEEKMIQQAMIILLQIPGTIIKSLAMTGQTEPAFLYSYLGVGRGSQIRAEISFIQ